MGANEWLITDREVVRLLRLTPRRSAQLKRLGLLKLDGTGYRFRELVGLRVATDLLDSGATVRQIRQALVGVKRLLPESEIPLAEIRLVLDGRKILVESDRVRFDPRTRQIVMVLDVEGLAADARATLARGLVRPLVPPAEAAEAWFQRAADCASAICFPDERVKFIDDEGNPGAPLQGQAVLCFGTISDTFLAEFRSFGFCALVKHGN